MTNIIIHGCNGHMGQVVRQIADADPDVNVIAGIDSAADKETGFPVFASVNDCHMSADAIIDFSTASAVDDLLSYGVKTGTPMVICTTGLSDSQLDALKAASGKVAVLRSANMSVGVNTIMKLVAEAAKILNPAGFDIEIMDMHHNRKLDAPSGTAIALADSANEALGGKMNYVFDRSGKREKRDVNDIGFAALRGGTVVGEHEVIFAGQDEVVKITHSAFSRDIFAKGAVAAAKFIAGRKPGLYDMSDVIG